MYFVIICDFFPCGNWLMWNSYFVFIWQHLINTKVNFHKAFSLVLNKGADHSRRHILFHNMLVCIGMLLFFPSNDNYFLYFL